MADKTTIILNVIIIAVLVGLFIQRAVTDKPSDDPGTYDFCVEWDGGITRENIIWKAYNFRTQTINWDWKIEGYDELVRFNPDNEEEEYGTHYCVRAVKSVPIEMPAININAGLDEVLVQVENVTDI